MGLLHRRIFNFNVIANKVHPKTFKYQDERHFLSTSFFRGWKPTQIQTVTESQNLTQKKETNVDLAEKLVAALYGVVLLSAVTPLASSGTIKLMECDFPGEIVGVGFDI